MRFNLIASCFKPLIARSVDSNLVARTRVERLGAAEIVSSLLTGVAGHGIDAAMPNTSARPATLLLALFVRRLVWLQDTLQQSLVINGLPPLTRVQLLIIANVANGERKAINIAKNLGVSRQAISQALAELQNAGVIVLEGDPKDRRSRIVRLAPGFERNGEVCARLLESIEHELGSRIGQRRLTFLRDALEAEWGVPPVIAPRDRVGDLVETPEAA